MYINKKNKGQNTMKKEVNKHNISLTLLKKLNVAKKDYDKVTEIKYNSDLKIQMPVYEYKKPSYTYKNTIRTFKRSKSFKQSFAPTDAKISSIYSSYQNSFRTNDVDKHISKYSKEDKA